MTPKIWLCCYQLSILHKGELMRDSFASDVLLFLESKVTVVAYSHLLLMIDNLPGPFQGWGGGLEKDIVKADSKKPLMP